ncbi:nonribosomal peptide synthase, partial [Aspergillus sp. HF37]
DKVDWLIASAARVSSTQTDQVVDVYPCTPTQRSLVERTVVLPGAYWLHNAFEIPAELDIARLERAWLEVVEAHAILRTRIFTVDDQHLQAVLRQPDPVRHMSAASLTKFLAADRTRAFTYGEPLLRAVVLTEPSDDQCRRYFVLTFHHSVYDVWSLTKIFGLLEGIYARLGCPEEADDGGEYQEVGFKYFVKALQDQDRGIALDFWKKYLLGTKTKPLVPPSTNTQANSMLRYKISLPLTGGLKAAGSSVTHAVMTYAALGLAFNRQLQSADTVMRLISMGRSTAGVPGIEDLVGPTITTAPLRINHTGKATLHDYLAHVHAQVRRLTPFEQIGLDDISHVHSDAEQACLSAPQIVVHPDDPYTQQPAAGLGLQRRELSAFNDDGVLFTMDISLVLQGKALEALDIRVVFDGHVVPGDNVRRLVVDLECIMQQIWEAPGSSHSDTPLDTIQRSVAETDGLDLEVERISSA